MRLLDDQIAWRDLVSLWNLANNSGVQSASSIRLAELMAGLSPLPTWARVSRWITR